MSSIPAVFVLMGIALQAETVSVFLVLKDHPQSAIIERVRAAHAAEIASSEQGYRVASATAAVAQFRFQKASEDLDAAIVRERRAIAAEIGVALRPAQDRVEQLVTSLGGRVLRRYALLSLVYAELPTDKISTAEASPDVQSAAADCHATSQLISTVPKIGAPALWKLGYSGAGESVAVLDTGIKQDHLAFNNPAWPLTISRQSTIERPGNDIVDEEMNGKNLDDLVGHGTQVAGVIASRGMPGEYAEFRGIAYGVSKLDAIKVGYKSKQSTKGNCTCADLVAGAESALTKTAGRVIVAAFSSEDAEFRFGAARLDELADHWNAVIVLSSGNVPGPTQVSDGPVPTGFKCLAPGTALNAITVGNFATYYGRYSGVGCLGDFEDRLKPDLHAPSDVITTSIDGNFQSVSGTSFSAAHVAGGAVLLSQYFRRNASSDQSSVTHALGIKAVILNTLALLPPLSSPVAAPGWDREGGWGRLRLDYALQRPFYRPGVLIDQPLYFRGRVPDSCADCSPSRTTLVWNRIFRSGVSDDVPPPPLRLAVYSAADGKLIPKGAPEPANANQNVFQVGLEKQTDVIVQVKAADVPKAGANWRFALAVPDASFQAATGPALMVSCPNSQNRGLARGEAFQLVCTIKNNGDLPAFDVVATVSDDAGLVVSPEVQVGTLEPGAGGQFAWTFSPPERAAVAVTISATSNSYGQTFTSGPLQFRFVVSEAIPVENRSDAVNCVASTGPVPTVRAESVAEFAADIVLTCYGGVVPSVAPGDRLQDIEVPNAPISVFVDWGYVNTGPGSSNPSWPVVLLDDPPVDQQFLCVPRGAGYTLACHNHFGVAAGPNAGDNKNVFYPDVGDWPGPFYVPLPPGGRHTLRIRNLLVAPSDAGVPTGAAPNQITATVLMPNLPGGKQTLVIALVNRGLYANTNPRTGDYFQEFEFREGTVTSFRPANPATTPDNPAAVAAANGGGEFPTESGFYNSAFTIRGTAGLAGHGTRLAMRLHMSNAYLDGFPQITASIAPVGGSSTLVARMIEPYSGNTTAVGDGPARFVTAIEGTPAPGYANLSYRRYTDEIVADIVYEVLAADPAAIETIRFGLHIPQGANGGGQVHASVGFAPVGSSGISWPRFRDSGVAQVGVVPLETRNDPGGILLPFPRITAVLNAATEEPVQKGIAPGTLVMIRGSNLASATASAPSPYAPALAADLAGTSVQAAVWYRAADADAHVPDAYLIVPLLRVRSDQILAVAPFELPADGAVRFQVRRGALWAESDRFPGAAVWPGILTAKIYGLGSQWPWVWHSSPTMPVTETDPLVPGEAIYIQCVGLGQLAVPLEPGTVVTPLPAATTILPEVTIGGVQAQVVSANLMPGSPAYYRVDVIVPAGLSSGSSTIKVTAGGVASASVGTWVAPAP